MEIPEVVILRLPLYVRALTEIDSGGGQVVSSRQLGEYLHITPAQIRKDLSYFGRFGRQGTGYNVNHLIAELKDILGLNEEWRACVVGVGRLGRAIVGYPGFAPEGFKVMATFDVAPKKLGRVVKRNLRIQPMSELYDTIAKYDISIGVVAVPVSHAQEVVNSLVDCGIKAILNYAPISLKVPADVRVSNIDPVLNLQSMTYYLNTLKKRNQASNRKRAKARAEV